MKFQNEKCACGLNLKTATPADEFFKRDEAGKMKPFGICPKCGRNNPMIEVEEVVPPAESKPGTEPKEEPEPKAKARHSGGTK